MRPGGIAYHHIADTCITLFTHSVPCGVWEAVYIVEGLQKSESDLQTTAIDADMQGQSYPVFSLAHLLRFELMPRIRNWKDSPPHRLPACPSTCSSARRAATSSTESSSSSTSRNLMRVDLPVRGGEVSSVLLRYLTDPQLRRRVTAATNKVEAFNGFSE
ncbi:Tn3 family transposase [Streptomyces puniciscabiei]